MHAPRRRRCRRLRRRARHRVAPPRTAPQPPRRRGHCDVYATLRRQMPQRRPLRRRQPSPPRPSRQRACACTCHRLRPPAPSSAPPVPYRRPPHPLRKQQRHARGARAAREVYHSQKRACSLLRTPLARPPTLGRGATSRRRAARAAVACPAPLPQLRPLVTLGVGYRLPEREVPAPQPRFRPAPSRGSAAVRRPPHRRLPRPRRTPTRAHAAQAPPSRSPARWQQPPRAPHPRWLLQGRTAMP
mmetsp:Transcript_20367/g.63150  ORF Transcript_20367/g.63150 Transcript_20367/m.63150 type:complete len:244 (+) Transcript_20367:325-1056(+)